MQLILRIKRQREGSSAPFFQEFDCEAEPRDTVLSLLEEINSRPLLLDRQGRQAEPVQVEYGCRQQRCGACAMLINGYPRLACSTFVGQAAREGGRIDLAPLSKFPVQADLRVDRGPLLADLKRMKLWLEQDAVVDVRELPFAYQSASCLMCGCCAEICPNYWPGQAFTGAAVMNQAYRAAAQSPPGKARRRLLRENIEAGQGHCSKTLSCRRVCPLELPLDYIISRGNFLYLQSLLKGKKIHEEHEE